ncbi:hypothetical protein AB3S75_016904 [Citrus x aurantiifolia]
MADNDDHHGKQEQPKWQGRACEELTGVKAEQIWAFLDDFFGLDKWFPTLTTCIPIQGISGQPGCVRFCAGFKTPVDNKDDDHEESVNWTKQKLLAINAEEMTLTYSIVDGNVGFYGYVSTLTVAPKENGCYIEWKYEVEPVKGWRLEDLDCFISSGLQVMARRMKEALQAYEVIMQYSSSS